jgi:hypothetical protein
MLNQYPELQGRGLDRRARRIARQGSAIASANQLRIPGNKRSRRAKPKVAVRAGPRTDATGVRATPRRD